MLRAIQLTNFQNHRSKAIHFDRHCTVLVGPNGSGKSAVIRALEWVAFNTWEGKADGFITWGQDSSTVKLWTDRHVIRRHKSSTENLYTLNGVDIRFDSVNRRSVPEPVLKAVGLSADNFQGQLDSAFWFSLTPGEVVRSLNRIVNLEEIDASLARASSKLRDAKTRVKVTEERLDQARVKQASLTWTVQAHRDMCTIEQVQAGIATTSARIAATERIVSAIRKAKRVHFNALAVVAQGREVLAIHQRIELAQRRANAVQAVIDRIRTQAARRGTIGRQIEAKQDQLVELEKRPGRVCPTCKRPL